MRDANGWAKYLDAALDRFGGDSDVVFAQHHWPVWGGDRVRDFLAKQRDLYKYLHDQAAHLMNHGLRPAEIAERLALPPGLAGAWHARGYYGTLSHNVKAVYQRYLGWYDANPAHLEPLPAVERAQKYVEYMGGAEAARRRAHEDFARGEYRFVAEAMSHLVFADPDDGEARRLGADALEQLGYQAESATWRNAYLLGARELRGGTPDLAARAPVSPDVVRAMPLDLFFDYLAVRIDGERAAGERYALSLSNGALTYRGGRQHPRPHATVTLSRATLDRLALRETTRAEAMRGGALRVHGDGDTLAVFFGLLDDFRMMFPVVEPPRHGRGAPLDSPVPRP